MLNGLVSGKSLAHRLEGRSVIADEVGLRVNADLENLLGTDYDIIIRCRCLFAAQVERALPGF